METYSFDVFSKYRNKTIYIFCHSFLSLPPTLNLLKIIENSKEVVIFVTNESVFDFFTKIVLKHHSFSIVRLYPLKKWLFFNSVGRYIHLQKIYKIYCKSKGDINAVFSSNAFVLAEYFLLKHLKKNKTNNIIYIIYSNYKYPVYSQGIFNFIKMLPHKILYGKHIGIGKVGQVKYMSVINPIFFNGVTHISEEVAFPNQNIPVDKYKVKSNFPIIFLTQPFPEKGVVQRKCIISSIYTLEKILKEQGINKSQIGIKYHPREVHSDMYNFGTGIPKYIPAEYLDISNCKIVISYYSSAFGGNYGRNVVRISLINFLDWHSTQAKNDSISYLKSNIKYNICFPTNDSELKAIISNSLKV